MFKRLTFILLLGALASSPVYAQDDQEWTCDEGPNDIVNAAQAAFDAGDLDRAEELAIQAQTVCTNNFARSWAAASLVQLIAGARATQAEAEDQPEAEVQRDFADVPYVPDGSRLQVLDIYLPDGADGPLPVVVFVHGFGGNKRDFERSPLFDSAAAYAYVSIEYRSPAVRGYRASLEDAFCALAWIHAEGKSYGLDPAQMVVVGLSLGGRLALTVAAVDTPEMFMAECPYPLPEDGFARAYVLWSASIVVPGIDPGLTLNGIAQTFKVDPADYAAWLDMLAGVPPQEWLTHTWEDERLAEFVPLLPLAWVNGNEPPILIIHGGRDEAVPVAEADALAAILEEMGAEFEYEMLPNMTHVDERYLDDLHTLMLDFVQQQVAGEDE